MLNSISITLLALTCVLAPTREDNPEILKIQELYKEAKAKIKTCQESEEPQYECEWYSNTRVVNSKQKPWRAVGTYQKTTTFWYTDDPAMAEATDETEESVLQFITIKYESTYDQYEEYLFEHGKLVFYFYHFSYAEENMQEHRFYFKDGKLLQYLQKGSSEEPAYTIDDAPEIQNKAEQLTQSFLSDF